MEEPIATRNVTGQVLALSDSGYLLIGGSTLLSPDGTEVAILVGANSGEYAFLSDSFYAMNQSLDIIGGSTIVTHAGATSELQAPSDSGPNPFLEALGLNNTGSAFGLITANSNIYSPNQNYLGSVRWSAPDYAPTLLQPLTSVDFYSPDISYQSVATGINDAGDVVGTCGNIWRRATLWAFGSAAPIDLNSLIPAGSGWTLNAAVGINNHGQIIGEGYYSPADSYAAFLLTPA